MCRSLLLTLVTTSDYLGLIMFPQLEHQSQTPPPLSCSHQHHPLICAAGSKSRLLLFLFFLDFIFSPPQTPPLASSLLLVVVQLLSFVLLYASIACLSFFPAGDPHRLVEHHCCTNMQAATGDYSLIPEPSFSALEYWRILKMPVAASQSPRNRLWKCLTCKI